jgi:pimeloyl-ACP methyl ester carboxylesterase
MYERFRIRPPFDLWDPLVLRDYCDYGVLPNPGGDGFVLACPPEIEAATYAGSAGADPYDHIANLTIPVRVLRARQRTVDSLMDMSSSPTTPDLASHFANATDYLYPELTHYLPMQAPGLVADHIIQMLA